MILRVTLAALLGCACLSFAGPARADALLTSGALPISATTIPRCVAINISKVPISSMNVALVNTPGSPPSTLTAVCSNVPPDGVCVSGGGEETSGNVFCRITAHASAKSIRGTMMTVLGSGDINATSEAR